MLYPLRNEPLTPERFANPGSEYRAAPFWAWNNKLDTHELLWQIDRLKEMGFGGFHMHVRTGMATEYLGEEYLDAIRACVQKAESENMLTWLYDEDRWPSGAAGGLVTQNHRYRQRFLVFSRYKIEGETPIAIFDVVLHPDGTLESYRRLRENEKAEGLMLYAYAQIAGDNPWFNNQAYLNTLDSESVQAFISTTHERFRKAVGDQFGSRIPAIFTDEPQFSRKGTLSYAQDDKPVTLPWSDDLPETFMNTYGENLLDGLPELLWDLPNGKASVLRYHFHDHIAERFASAFADQCGAWCAQNGMMLTGHMMEEPTLKSQTAALGDAMRSYRSFQLPGIDMLCDWHEYTTAKQAQSASRQYGREGVLSELYGVTNWNFDFRGHKLQGDWQAALGVTVRVPHLSWVSMNGEAKRDYPASFNYQSPWYHEYKYVEDHFARVNTALTRGKALCRVGVIHPVESYWLHWGAKENTEAIRSQMDERFATLTEWLIRGLVDFDFICESLLPSQCPAEFTAEDGFPVGSMHYETVIVPPVETLRTTTLERLRHFREQGGRIIFLQNAPALVDALPNGAAEALYQRCEQCAFDRVQLLDRMSNLRDLEIRDQNGVITSNLLYQLRQDGENRWLFVCHADNPQNPDIPTVQTLQIRLRGAWRLEEYDTLTGTICPVSAAYSHGWTVMEVRFSDHDSLLLRLNPAAAEELPVAIERKQECSTTASVPLRFLDGASLTLEEPNVLLLDMAEYALDNGPYRPREEILRLDQILRKELGWPLRGEAWAQPWVEANHSTLRRLRLRYTFMSEIEVQNAELALENAGISEVCLNGQAAKAVQGWYVDKCIGKRVLPPIVRGENTLEINMPYGRLVDVEPCYLLGNFGVCVNGTRCTLVQMPQSIGFGDITHQGMPFYGGNLIYRLSADLEPGLYELEVSRYRAHLVKIALDGKEVGVIAYAPYHMQFEIHQGGIHSIDLTAYGCRINTFGQVHHANKATEWWGPDSWRSEGPEWSYEYNLWPQGILKSPEIRRVR